MRGSLRQRNVQVGEWFFNRMLTFKSVREKVSKMCLDIGKIFDLIFEHTKNSVSFPLVLLRHYTCTKLKVTSETVKNTTQRAGVCLSEAVLEVHGLKKVPTKTINTVSKTFVRFSKE